jgi:RNase adaptor protein for sRNA GlmZ degradation
MGKRRKTKKPCFRLVLQTFGFRRGGVAKVKPSPDLVLKTHRLLPAAYKHPGYKALDGNFAEVKEFLNRDGNYQDVLKIIFVSIITQLELYFRHGQREIHVAIGSLWGRHRAVAICDDVKKMLQIEYGASNQFDMKIKVVHHHLPVSKTGLEKNNAN